MVDKKNILTYEGLKLLEEELHELKVNKRKDIAQKIKEAREQGDLSENAEYDAAKEEQANIEKRIGDIEEILKNAEIIEDNDINTDIISIGCTVKLLDYDMEEEVEYTIVGSTEADVLNNKISNESPVGEALLGKEVGDEFFVETKGGELKFKVLEIKK